MSEYQYYEFQALDRPLNEEDMAAVGRLSSRVELSPNRAIFVYNYSDLPTSAERLLAQYFDAMFYITNWGSCQLMFRFPKQTVDLEQMQAYQRPEIVQEFVSVTEEDGYVLLNMRLYDEEPEWGWVDGEGWLSRLVSLRDDITRGDYRLLYLAWLRAIILEEEILDEVEEPPVPAGLTKLSAGLRAFIELFYLDPSLVKAAAQTSGALQDISEAQLRQAIGHLSAASRDRWFLRLAQGEPQLADTFQRELLKSLARPQQAATLRRTAADLLAAAETVEEEERIRRTAAAKARHLKKMRDLAGRDSQIWQEVIELIDRKTGKAYDEAVVQLKDLKDLAIYRQHETQFQARLNKIYLEYRSRSALLRRLRQAGLYEQ